MSLLSAGAFALTASLVVAGRLTPNGASQCPLTAAARFLNHAWLRFACLTPAESLAARIPDMSRLRQPNTRHQNAASTQRHSCHATCPPVGRPFGPNYCSSRRALPEPRSGLRSESGPT
jgi:hypothetical protein